MEVLKDDELVEILDRAKPLEYQQELLAANYDPYAKTFAEFSQYLLNLEQRAAIAKALDKQKGNTSSASSRNNMIVLSRSQFHVGLLSFLFSNSRYFFFLPHSQYFFIFPPFRDLL